MSVDGLLYLLSFYWPYMAVALVIGLVVGWLSGRPRKT